MKNQFQPSMIISFTVLLASLLFASATILADQHSDGSKRPADSVEQERGRMEMDMQKSTHEQPPTDDNGKIREQMRTTEEMSKESGMMEQEKEQSRKWWEFWK